MIRYLPESLPGRTNARLLVADHEAELKTLKTHGELFAFAKRHGVNDGRDFAQFKRSLYRLGIDYDWLREQAQHDRLLALESRCKTCRWVNSPD